MSVSVEQVQAALKEVIDPNTQKDFMATKSARNIKVEGGKVSLDIVLPYPAKMVMADMGKLVEDKIKGLAGVESVQTNVSWKIVAHSVQKGVKLIPGVKNIIAVASGKGGVGKSTTAVNLALALAAEGANVGMLDADIYGPSQPTMLGIHGRPESPDGQNLEPMLGHGLQAMSIGFLIDVETPMVWRGPMVTQALEQLLNNTKWKDLDYLVVDLPPGTGDIQLTLAQRVPVTGAVIVTTPQDVAILDSSKAVQFIKKLELPVLGIVENMSGFICPHCKEEIDIFGKGGGEKEAKELGVPFLGAIPLDPDMRKAADEGRPFIIRQAGSAENPTWKSIDAVMKALVKQIEE